MNNVFVYIELENGVPADVSLELLTKGRELATTLGVKLEAVVLGHNLGDIAQELAKYGADTVWTADDKEFAPGLLPKEKFCSPCTPRCAEVSGTAAVNGTDSIVLRSSA